MVDSLRLDDAVPAGTIASDSAIGQAAERFDGKVLHRSTKVCAFRCSYCFADFSDFQSSEGLGPVRAEATGENVILYPTCDSEFQGDREARLEIDRLIRHTQRKVCVSISTKGLVTAAFARRLADWNAQLRREERGILKFSLSITTSTLCEELEPMASTYEERLRSLYELASAGVPTSVNLKPILPMVDVEEYAAIVEDTSRSCAAYLIGGLYLDLSTPFGAEVAATYGHLVTRRRVDWMPGETVWPYCEDPGQIENIRLEILSRGGAVFDSDADLVNALARLQSSSGM